MDMMNNWFFFFKVVQCTVQRFFNTTQCPLVSILDCIRHWEENQIKKCKDQACIRTTTFMDCGCNPASKHNNVCLFITLTCSCLCTDDEQGVWWHGESTRYARGRPVYNTSQSWKSIVQVSILCMQIHTGKNIEKTPWKTLSVSAIREYCKSCITSCGFNYNSA